MIYNYSCIFSIYIIFYYCYYPIIWAISDFLILSADNNVIKCSNHEYIIITDWSKFIVSNISCPNQIAFSNKSTRVYLYDKIHYDCYTDTKTFSMSTYSSIFSMKKNQQKITDIDLSRLSSTVRIKNHNYSCKAEKRNNDYIALVNKILINWSSTMKYSAYVKFTEHPTICLINVDFSQVVNNKKCTNSTILRGTICYSEPFSKLELQNVNWTEVENFLFNKIYVPINWEEKGGYYLNAQSTKTTIKSIVSYSMF